MTITKVKNGSYDPLCALKYQYTSIPVYQHTSRCHHPCYPGIDDSALDVDAPSSR